MSYTDAQHAAQDAVNLLGKLRGKCTNLVGWGYLFRAQRYLIDPEGYRAEIAKLAYKSREFESRGMQLFQS